MDNSFDWIDEASASLLKTIAEVEKQERFFAQLPEPSVAQIWQESLNQLEGNLSRWQHLLGDAGEQVRLATDELSGLDRDLRQAVSAFAAARKYLQGETASIN